MLTSLAPAVVVGAAVIGQSFGEWVHRHANLSRFVLIVACTAPLMFMTWNALRRSGEHVGLQCTAPPSR